MKPFLITLTYRVPQASGRRDDVELERGLAGAQVRTRWADDVLEVEIWEEALKPSDAVAVGYRQITDLWPDVWATRDLTPSSADTQDRASGDDDDRVPGDQDRAACVPGGGTGMLVLESVSWQYSHGGEGLAGVREPRRPAPSPGHLAAALEVPDAVNMR